MEDSGVIAKLSGLVDVISDGTCVIDVNGVGYLVFASSRTLAGLPQNGLTSLLIDTQVREDAIALYGFSTAGEREWFRLLTTVQGVGAKVALALLSALSPDQLIAAIATADRAALTRAPGWAPNWPCGYARSSRQRSARCRRRPRGVPSSPAPQGAAADALSALLNLGYRRAEAEAALANVAATQGKDVPLDVLIRGGLKALAR